MAKASVENNNLKKILTHLTALDKKVDKGFKEADKQFKEAAEFRQQTEENFSTINKRVDEGFKEAAEFRQQTEESFSTINKRVDEGFKEAAEFQKKTEDNFAGFAREIREIGSFLYDKTAAYHQESLKFQRESYLFQQQSQVFQQQTQASLQESRVLQQQTRDFQNAMLITVQDIREAFQRFERNQSIIQETFKQLKVENEELKKARVAHEATIKKLEQRVAILEAVQG